MAHAKNIDQHFLELKNSLFNQKNPLQKPHPRKKEKIKNPFNPSFHLSLNQKQQGLYSELLVAYHYLKKGYQLLNSRFKICFVEIDLLFKDQKEDYLAIEVKSLKSENFLHLALQEKQVKRLKKAILYLQNKVHKNVRLHLATVGRRDEIKIYEDVLSFF